MIFHDVPFLMEHKSWIFKGSASSHKNSYLCKTGFRTFLISFYLFLLPFTRCANKEKVFEKKNGVGLTQ